MLTLTFQNGDSKPRTVELVAPRSTIGRRRDCTISLFNATLSRVHAVVLREGTQWEVQDQGSSGGTFINRQKVQRAPIVPGDTINVGNATLLVGESPPLSAEMLQMLGTVQQGNEAQRQVFADWLEGRGELEQADYVRAELELQRMPGSAELGRLKLLTESVSARFRAQVSRPKIEECHSSGCPKQWAKLELTSEPRERSCSACRKIVTFCDSVEEGRQLVDEDQPVSVEVSRERAPRDLRPLVVVG